MKVYQRGPSMVVQLSEGDTGVGGADKRSRRTVARSASNVELVGSSRVWTWCDSGSKIVGRHGGTHSGLADMDSGGGGSSGGLHGMALAWWCWHHLWWQAAHLDRRQWRSRQDDTTTAWWPGEEQKSSDTMAQVLQPTAADDSSGAPTQRHHRAHKDSENR
jgi:hypothetical protein